MSSIDRIKSSKFNTPMVCAILEKRKSVTRRIAKISTGTPCNMNCTHQFKDYGNNNGVCTHCGLIKGRLDESYFKSKYSKGDILFVSETWTIHDLNDGAHCMMIRYRADGSTALQVEFPPSRYAKFEKFYYKNGWQSSYFMPREAARLFLRVTDVRLERLQDITEEQAVKEGCLDEVPFIFIPKGEYHKIPTARDKFVDLWNSTVNKSEVDYYGWNANPWVWVYEFERISKEEALTA